MFATIFTKIKTQAWLMIAIVIGLGFRLWHLTSISLWHDEAFSALLIKYSWSEMMHRIGLDVHPPMYYIFLRFWHYIFGDSLLSLRGMSVFFGVLTIIVVFYFVKYIFRSNRIALFSAFLMALNPFSVQYVTEARMYTMGAFFAVLTAFLLTLALRTQLQSYQPTISAPSQPNPNRQKIWGYYLLFVLSGIITMYTHYYLLFILTAIGVYGILFCIIHYKANFKQYLYLILSGILIGIAFLPWLKIFLFQYKQVEAGYWIPVMDRWSIPNTLWELTLRLPNQYNYLLILLSAVTLLLIFYIIWKVTQTEKWLILGAFLAPFAGAILFLVLAKLQGSNSSVYMVRYFIFCVPFYLILIAIIADEYKIKAIGNLFIAGMCILSIYSIWNYWNKLDVTTKPGVSAMSQFLNANIEPGQKLFVSSSFEFFNYKYYNKSSVRPLLYTDGHLTKDLPHYAGTAILTDEDLVLNFQTSTKAGDIVWLIWTDMFGGTKPTIPTTWQQLDEKQYPEVRPYVGTNVYVTEYVVQ